MNQDTKILNEEVVQMIISWINNFDFKPNIKNIHQLSNGDHLSRLAACFLKINSIEQINTLDIQERFEFIEKFIQDRCRIKENISYDNAKEGNTFELAKIAFITLFNGIVSSKDEFINASDKLHTTHVDLIQRFYELLDTHRLKIPLTAQLYEEFLSKPQNELTPRSKRVLNKIAENTPNQATYLLSPMQKASLNSPKNSCKKKLNEEEVMFEKRRLEKELKHRDLEVEELSDQIHEKETKLNHLESKLEEYMRKVAELVSYREKAYEYDSIIEKYHVYEKEHTIQLEKIKKLTSQIDELNKIKENYETQQNNLRNLNEQLDNYEKKERTLQIELKRLKKLENDLQYSNERIKSKEEDILKLLNEKANLENDLKVLNNNFNEKRMQYEEKIDQYSGENAMYQNEINLLNANINNLTEQFNETLNSLKIELEVKQKKLDEENQNLDELNSELKRKIDEINDLKQQILVLTQDIKHIEELNKQKEIQISVLEADINKKIQENECLQSCLNTERFYLQEEKERYEKRYSQLHKDYENKHNYCLDVEANLKKLNELNKKYEIDLNELKLEITNSTAKINNLELIKEQLQTQLNKLQDNNRCKEDEINKLKKELNIEVNEKTKLKKEYIDEKSYFESRINVLDNEIKQLNVNKQSLKEEIEALDVNLKQQYAKIDSEIKVNMQLNAEIDDLKLKNDTLTHEIDKINIELNFKCEQLNECVIQKENLEIKLNELTRNLENSLEQIENLRIEALNIEKAHDEKNLQNETKIKTLLDELEQLRNEFKQKYAELDNINIKQAAEFEDNILKLKDQLNQIFNENTKLNYDLNIANNLNKDYSIEIGDLKAQLAEKFDILEKTFIKLNETECRFEQTKSDFELKIEQMNAEIDDKLNEINRHVSIEVQLRNDIESNLNKIENLTETLNISERNNEDLNQKLANLHSESEQKLIECKEIEAELQKRLSQYESELHNLNQVLHERENELKRIQNEFLEFRNQSEILITEYKEKLSYTEFNLNEKINEINIANNKISDLTENFNLKSDENDLNLKKLEDLRRDSEEKINECKQIEVELKKTINKYENELKYIEENLKERENELETTREALNVFKIETENKIFEYDSRVTQLEGKLIEENNKFSNLNEDFNKKCAENDDLLIRVTNSENVRQREEIEYKHKVEELNSNLVKTVNDLNNNFTLKINELNELKKTEAEKYEEKILGLENILNETNSKLTEVNTNLADTTSELTLANNKINQLNENLSNKVSENEQYMKKLHESELEREHELIEHKKKVDELNLHLTKTINEVNNEFEMKIKDLGLQKQAESEKYEAKIHSLEEILCDGNAKIIQVESCLNEKQREVTEHKKTIDNLNNQINELNSKFEIKLNELNCQKQNENEILGSKINCLENILNSNNQKLNEISNENLNYKTQITENELKISQYEQMINKIKQDYDLIQNRFNDEQSKLNQTLNDNSLLKSKINEKDENLSKLEENINKLNNDIVLYKQEFTRLNKEKEENLQNYNQIIMQKSQLEHEKISDKYNINELEMNIREKCNVIDNLNLKLDEYIKNIEQQNQHGQYLIKQNETIMSEYNNEKQKWLNAYESQTNENKELKMQVTTLNNKLNEQNQVIEEQKKAVNILESERSNFNEAKFIEIKNQLELKQQELDLLKKENKLHEENKFETNKTHETAVKTLQDQLQSTQKENDNLKRYYTDLKEHLQKFEEHYNKKKLIFQKNETTLAETTKKLGQYEDKICSLENIVKDVNDKYTKTKQDHEQLNEHHKALTNENRSLKTSIDYLERKLKETQKNQQLTQSTPAVQNPKVTLPSAIKRDPDQTYGRESLYGKGNMTNNVTTNNEKENKFFSLGRSAGAKAASLLKTPKAKQFLDDSSVKYTADSPDFRTQDNDFFPIANPDDVSFRRQSIDTIASARSGYANSTMGASGHPINRFDAISENDFEAAFNSEKFLPFENNQSSVRNTNDRLSILQTRNLKQKPHLKSSYPLEALSFPEIDENHIREGRHQREILKSKVNLKRPYETDSNDLSPTKKTQQINIDLSNAHKSDVNQKSLKPQQTSTTKSKFAY